MATAEFLLSVPAVEITDEVSDEEDTALPHVDSSVLLADAIRRADGLIGDFKPEPLCESSSDPVVMAIMDCCTKLYLLIRQWNSQHRDAEVGGHSHASNCIASDVKQLIMSWFANGRMESPVEVDQLRRDKDELLNQLVSMQQQQESVAAESSKLSKKIDELERRCTEKDQQNRSLSEDLKATKSTLHSKEVEVRHLKDELQASYRTNSPLTSNASKQVKHVTVMDPNGIIDKRLERGSGKGSFRKSLFKALGRKKEASATVELPDPTSSAIPNNPRAAEFCAKDSRQLADWFSDVGLDMYTDIVERNLASGERLVTMVAANNNALFAQIGVVSTLHCKKLRLAVEDAISEIASPMSELDHHWVADWLTDIGLPQYQRKFLDARIDCRMLNSITVDNLNLLDIDAPFHVASLKTAIMALRMCSYKRDYLKDASPESGSKKLLYWSSKEVADWIRNIELDEYVGGLEEAGIHGAFMLLDVHFTIESLAGALGISHSMVLIRNHLSRKFMELIGPIAAQKKYDAMQSKNFVALDPSEQGKTGHRARSRSMGSRKGRNQEAKEILLCPCDEQPVKRIEQVTLPATGSPSLVSDSTTS